MTTPSPVNLSTRSSAPLRQLTLFDSTCIIVGIIIGATIYESSPLIAGCVPGLWELLGVWLLGGAVTLIGSLCYAELATAYPNEGGDYVYLTRAFGRRLGFVFAWVQLWVVRPGSIGALAYVFADYAHRLWPAWWGQPVTPVAYAVIAVAVLTAINVLGVQEGKWTQNLLTTIKVLALLGIFVVGILAPSPAAETTVHPANVTFDFRFAMILILYAYGGWNEMAYVGAEVQRPEKNIVRALLLGTLTVTVIYLLVNLAFVRALGFSGLVHSKAVAADVLKLAAGAWGERLMCTLVCISALGAVNGTIFTGGRIYYAMGTDHKLFAWLGQWSPRFGTPAWSLVIQAIITIALVIAFGWNAEGDGFEAMVIFTAPLFWGFLVLVGMSLFALRDREPATPRPFRVPLYPLIPILFCHATLLMFYASVSFAYEMRSYEALWPIALLAVGIAMSFIGRGDQD